MEKLIILQGITVEQLIKQIEITIEEKLANVVEQLKPQVRSKYITRKEVADLLKISLPTLRDWSKLGWVRSYKIGNSVLYKSDEIEESILSRKHKRFNFDHNCEDRFLGS